MSFKKYKFHGRVKEGKLRVYAPKDLNKRVERLNGKEVTVTIQEKLNNRTTKQNSYYWAVVDMIAGTIREAGQNITIDEVHELLKSKFNTKEVSYKGNKLHDLGESTTDLNTAEFNEYILKIKVWCLEFLSLEIPDPGEQIVMDEN